MESQKITYQLESNGDKETLLKNTANDILARLKNKFGHEYAVTANEFGTFDKDWSHEIKVRKGNKIGAEVGFKWEQANPEVVALEVDESSKMGSQITYGIILPFLVIGAYLGYNDMAPLEFLPGKKLAGGLGALIALVPAVILVTIAKSLLLKKEKAQNAELVNAVSEVIRK